MNRVIRSNKLLLESLRQTRRDSMLNLQSSSVPRVSESFDGTSGAALGNALFRPTSVQRFTPILETIEDQPGHPPAESPSLHAQSPLARGVRRTGSTQRIPYEESLSSMTSVYGSTADVNTEGKPLLHRKRAMSASFAPSNRPSIPQSRSISVSNVAQEEEWHVNSRLKLRLLFRRIMDCFYRDPLFLMGHTNARSGCSSLGFTSSFFRRPLVSGTSRTVRSSCATRVPATFQRPPTSLLSRLRTS